MGIGSIAIGADSASVAWQAHIGGFSPAWCCFRCP
jgi:membrane associated rhomboid family serine protease